MKRSEFVNKLIAIVNKPTYYSNKYPNNLGYVHPDGRRSFDCWNLIKAVLNGYDPDNNTVGYYQKNLSITGDTDINGLMNQCTSRGTDFTKLVSAGSILKYSAGTHAGVYVGSHTIDGREYNVIECTASWDKRVLWSWVDIDGTRRHYRGGSKNGQWVEYGIHKSLEQDVGLIQTNVGGAQAEAGKKQEDADIIHVVQKGESLWSISQKYLGYGIKWREIYNRNNLKSTTIQIGQKLIIPKEV